MLRDTLLLAPEVVLCVGAFLVILLDLMMPAGRSRRPLLYLSLFTVIVAGGLAFSQMDVNRAIFSGLVLVDTFGTFFKLMFLVSTALVLLAIWLGMSCGCMPSRGSRWSGCSWRARGASTCAARRPCARRCSP